MGLLRSLPANSECSHVGRYDLGKEIWSGMCQHCWSCPLLSLILPPYPISDLPCPVMPPPHPFLLHFAHLQSMHWLSGHWTSIRRGKFCSIMMIKIFILQMKIHTKHFGGTLNAKLPTTSLCSKRYAWYRENFHLTMLTCSKTEDHMLAHTHKISLISWSTTILRDLNRTWYRVQIPSAK